VRGASGSALDLPGGLTVRREYDTIIIEPVSEVPADDTPDFPAAVLHVPGVTRLDLLDMSIDCLTAGPEAVDSEIGNDVAFLDAGVIKGRGLVRPPKAGDRVRPFGMSGVKKLSDIFIDTKTPRRVRRMTPVVEFDGNIVWIAGYCIDDRYKVTEETRKVMVLRLLKGSS
jgi:tRNA(Ile)-lysidine synthase